MSNPIPNNPNPNKSWFDYIDAYLDNKLNPKARAAFEARLAKDQTLRAEVELARAIETSIRRTHVPAPVALPPNIQQPTRRHAASARSRKPWLRRYGPYLAAAVLAAAFTVQYLVTKINWNFTRWNASEFYAIVAKDNFAPEFVCTTDTQFADTTSYKVGQSLLFHRDAPGNIEVVGWSYWRKYGGTPIDEGTLVLLAKVEGQPVVVLMEPADTDRPVRQGNDPALHVFRRKLDSVVMYEITPRPSSAVIDAIYVP